MEEIEEMKFEILIPTKVGRNEQYLTTNTNVNSVTVGTGILDRIGATEENPEDIQYVRFAKIGSDFYISNKPEGTFGYSLRKASASTRKVSNGRSLIESGLNSKMYSLGEMVTRDEENWYKLCKVVS